MPPAKVHDVDFLKVIESDVVIAIGDFASWGAGKELAWAERFRTPVLVLLRNGRSVSRLVEGTSADIEIARWRFHDDIREAWTTYFLKRKAQLEDRRRTQEGQAQPLGAVPHNHSLCLQPVRPQWEGGGSRRREVDRTAGTGDSDLPPDSRSRQPRRGASAGQRARRLGLALKKINRGPMSLSIGSPWKPVVSSIGARTAMSGQTGTTRSPSRIRAAAVITLGVEDPLRPGFHVELLRIEHWPGDVAEDLQFSRAPPEDRDGRLKFRRAYPSDGHLVPRHHDLLARLVHVPEHLEAVVPELPRPDGPNANGPRGWRHRFLTHVAIICSHTCA